MGISRRNKERKSTMAALHRIGIFVIISLAVSFAEEAEKQDEEAPKPKKGGPQIPAWIGKNGGARHLEALRSDTSLSECAEDNKKCHEETKHHLDEMILDKDIVFFADICTLYACRHAPYSSKLGVCENLSPKRTVLSKLYESSKVNFSDIGHCANDDPECDVRVRTLMDNMVSHKHKDFVVFLNNVMLYVCEHASYDVELAVCAAANK